MIYIFSIALALNIIVLIAWLKLSDWKFSVDDYLFVTFTAVNILGFALAIRISM